MTEAVVAVVQPEAIRHNLKRLRKAAPGCRFMAVIKANAYGHGSIEIARLLQDEVDALAVARVAEGVTLREAGIRQRIVVLDGCSQLAEFEEAIRHKLEVVVHDPAHFAMLEAVECEAMLDIWVKLDTGMGRLGFAVKACKEVMQRIAKISCVKPDIRLMTHLACADDPDNPMTMEQLRRFGAVLNGFKGDVSIANSAAILLWPPALESAPALDYKGDNWVRPGLALFGASPVLGKSAREMGLKPAMSFESHLIAVKTIRRGNSVGYGSQWRARRDTVVGVVAVGYGDGYPRQLQSGTPVIVNDRRVALIGRVSMDMINVDLTDVPVAKVGDRVVLWGGQLPIEEIAARAGTIPYELMCGLGRRVGLRIDEASTDSEQAATEVK